MSFGKTEKDYPPIKGETFWVRKIRTLFRRLDWAGRGKLTMDDFLEVASCLIAEYPKMLPDLEDQLVKKAIDFWITILSRHLPNNLRVGGFANEVDFVRNMKETSNGEFREKFRGLLVEPYFLAVDSDGDGKITLAEFRSLMVAWKAPPNEADLAFKLMDTKRTNKMDLQSFNFVMAEFFFCEDQKSKLKQLWGVLVSYKRPEDFPECNCSPVWESKMRNMFRRLDVSGNGSLRCDDFIEIGKNLAQRGHLNKPKTHSLMKAMLDIWVKFFGIDKDGKQFDEIQEQQFIRNLRERINTDFRHEIDQLGWSFFKAVEVGGLGCVTLQEYRNLQESWNVSREEADGMFKSIDTDKDGKITSDEYMNAWCDYFLGEDNNSIYKTFFGPIIVRHIDHR